MDLEQILTTIQPFIVMFVALTAAFLTAIWFSAVIWTFRDIRSRTRDVFAQILATLMVLIFFPLFPLPGMILYLILRPRETLAEIYERTLEEEALLQGIEERLACPTCNRRIEEDYVVCPACHTRLKKGCVSCGRLLHLSWSICAYCGAAQTTTQTVMPPQPVSIPIEPPAEASALPEPMVEPDAGPEGEPETELGGDEGWMAEEEPPTRDQEPGMEEEAAEFDGAGSEAEPETEDEALFVEEESPGLDADSEPAPEEDSLDPGTGFEPEADAGPAEEAGGVVPEEA
jgi:RNA polymerase subunit RPABC4/transcription elongation factor Spt4